MARKCAQSGVTYGSPTFLVSPGVGTVFSEATLVIDTLNTSELASGNTVGTRADVICAHPPLAALLQQPACSSPVAILQACCCSIYVFCWCRNVMC